MPRFKDQAICIRLIDFSETSQIVALLTEQHGKVRGLAKGSKRMSPGSVARFSGGIELLTGGQIVATTRPSTELAAITEWDLQQPNWHLHEDLAAQRLAMYGADVCNAMLAELDPHPHMHAVLAEFLAKLADRPQHAMALLMFQWHVLDDCGYRPQLDEDVVRGGPFRDSASYRFDPLRGGITVDSASAGSWGVRRQTVQLLRAVAEDSAQDDPVSIERANRLLCVYLRSILDRQLPTMQHVLGAKAP